MAEKSVERSHAFSYRLRFHRAVAMPSEAAAASANSCGNVLPCSARPCYVHGKETNADVHMQARR
jgi:hypothetical protein